MSALNIRENNGAYGCHYDQELLAGMAKATRENSEAIKTLVTYHREMTRWLLIVVCVIALGNRFVEMAKDVWGTQKVEASNR